MKNRCGWVTDHEIYRTYHDTEWGVPVKDDAKQFEFLVLESFQAGLSWLTILKKRENFRKAFDNFDYKKIARYNQEKIDMLMQDAGIIRNKLKIKATIGNAQAFIKIQEEFGSFTEYIWGFVNHKPVINHFKSLEEVPASTALSDKISADLKKRGFKFMGTTIVYAHLQATGLVMDHTTDCSRYKDLKN